MREAGLPYLCGQNPVRVRRSDRLVLGRDGVLGCAVPGWCRLLLKLHIVRRSLDDRQVGARCYSHVNAAVGAFLAETSFDGLLRTKYSEA